MTNYKNYTISFSKHFLGRGGARFFENLKGALSKISWHTLTYMVHALKKKCRYVYIGVQYN